MKCKLCDRSFRTSQHLNGHMKVHSPHYDEHRRKVATISTVLNTQGRLRRDAEYAKNPKYCFGCKEPLPRLSRQKYCSLSCRARHVNRARPPRSRESRQRLSDHMAVKFASRRRVWGPFSRITRCECVHCGAGFVARKRAKYCRDHRDLYGNRNRNRYAFAFSIRKYPDLFGKHEEILRAHGLWSYTNTGGITRDHRVSVNEAIKSGLDPYYITHPINCELIPWKENNAKKTRSSITYESLVKEVDAYDAARLAVRAGIEPALQAQSSG